MSDPLTSREPRIVVDLGSITRVTLNRPSHANALDVEMGYELEAAVAHIAKEPGVRVVVLQGAGEHFSAGGDFAFIEENTALSRERVWERMLRFYQMYLSVLELPVPTIARLHGSAIGAGLCLALACDVRVGARSSRLGANFLRVGLHPGMGATLLLSHVVGPARAARLMLTAETVGGERALELGLLSELAPDDELSVVTERLARQVASGAPSATRRLVATLRASLQKDLPAALAREAECQADDFGGEDVRAAVDAFRRGEKPDFSAR
ncbi:MAG TPA: enoyl-CoA hydratase/isomerase family protein [Polyangiaceae bacterium]|nr:enoyl-CoA hydratase/isomerase family protein [Polyangiaceae bacterium]